MSFALKLALAPLAGDGFHPGSPLYRLWGEGLAGHVAEVVWPRLEGPAATRYRSAVRRERRSAAPRAR